MRASRPASLVRLPGDRLVLRMVLPSGERMAAPLRPMTLTDAFSGAPPPRLER